MEITACYDKLNNRREVACSDCYAHKDTLKSIGFRWNSNSKEWVRRYETPEELARILASIMIDCDLPFEVYEDMYRHPCNDAELETISDLSVWDAEDLKVLAAKYDLDIGDTDACEEAKQEIMPEEVTASESTALSNEEALDLVIRTNLHRYGDAWFVDNDTPAELQQLLKKHKPELIRYMTGECFHMQATIMRRKTGIEWVVYRVSNSGDVGFKPVEIFAGTAISVDNWCREHADDPLFTDKYTSMYDIGWRERI